MNIYVFGPIQSRRLGKSLGVNLMPFKTCSLDCVYCECGKTTELTSKRGPYVDTKAVKEQLHRELTADPEIDYVTFSGSGEPTLHSDFIAIVKYIKQIRSTVKIALLTNSLTLTNSAFMNQLLAPEINGMIDLVVPSLDAATPELFQLVNRPVDSISIYEVCDALRFFTHQSKAKIWLEVFIIAGHSDQRHELEALAKVIKTLRVDIIQLNSLDRPAAYDWVESADMQTMQAVKFFFETHYQLNCEIIAKVKSSEEIYLQNRNKVEALVNLLVNRPSTEAEIAKVLDIHERKVMRYLARVPKPYKVLTKEEQRGIFYFIREKI